MRPTRFGGGCGGRATYAGWGEFGGGLCDLRWLEVEVVEYNATYGGRSDYGGGEMLPILVVATAVPLEFYLR